MEDSRTKKTIKNVQISLIYYFVSLVLNFFSRQVFIKHLGAEVLGLNTTATSLLGMLNLAELGIGTAIAYSLYTPLYNKDKQAICDIVSVQGWLYRKIAYIILGAAIVLMLFFPLIFAKVDVPMWYTYATFAVLLFSGMLGYFINYKQIVLTADQKDYKVIINLKGFTIIKILLQIVCIIFLSNGYIYWLALEVLAAIAISIALNKLLKKEYPWLTTSISQGALLRKKYPDIIVKTKQLFVHKIGTFALLQSSPIILYAFASLTLVAIYGNYMLIITAIATLAASLFSSMNAGVGSLVAEGNKDKIINMFWKLATFRFWLASVFCFLFYLFANTFISVWVGQQYILETTPFVLLAMYLFVQQIRVCDIFLNAYGLYKDVFAPLVEAILNIGLSILFGYFWNLSGILIGVLISQIIIVCTWKPYFLFRNGFAVSPIHYFKVYAQYLVFIAASFVLTYILNERVLHLGNDFVALLAKASVYIVLSLIIFVLFRKKDFVAVLNQILQIRKAN
ncbi:MAG: sugar transporter [Bacteroidales bacterium]|jgi:O-antigen/teichoic acid export membrane protein|nr:sugar transporter [Bacteroidales bacterium]